jgi:chemotaxis protein methyltransferase WspC
VNLAPVLELLRHRIGLDPDSLGTTALGRTVAARAAELGLAGTTAYAARLAVDPQELQVVLADVAVPETWFFRGGAVFDYLARRVADAGPIRASGTRFRTLSVPCSTGEEPYSFAIALAEAGVPPGACEIEAVDLSAAHLDKARRARFSDFSFRQTPPGLCQRYFRPVDGGWELDPAIRAGVRFRQGNLLDPGLLAGAGPFDLIFCRNLFIYLHREARRQVLDTLAGLLAPDGRLCTGHAEPLEFQDTRFTPAGPPEYFLYRMAPTPVTRPLAIPAWSPPPRLEPASPPTVPREGHKPEALAKGVAAFAQPPTPVELLDRARRQADGGQLADALASCREQLAGSGPSADLYSLMGLIHQARGERGEAVVCYQRALYMEREHAEALSHLMLLYQEQGNHAQAERLRRRLGHTSGGEA